MIKFSNLENPINKSIYKQPDQEELYKSGIRYK